MGTKTSAVALMVIAALVAFCISGCGTQKGGSQEAAEKQDAVAAASEKGAATTATPTREPAPAKVEPVKAVAVTTEPTETEAGPTGAVVEPTQSVAEPTEEDTGMPLRSMDEFDSYRQQVTMVWAGAEQEMPEMTVLQEFVREPPASRNVTTIQNQDGSTETIEIVQIGDTAYTKVGDDWFASTREDSEGDVEQYTAWANPNDFMSSGDCRLVDREQVGGLDAKHYTCGEELLIGSQETMPEELRSTITLARVDTWVSTRFEVAVKTEIYWEGADPDGNEATYTFESIVYDINEPITIEPPEGTEAPDVPDDVPMVDGATDVQISGQPPMVIINFGVSLPAEDVTSFYRDEMPKQGWTTLPSPIPAMMNFEKAGRTAMIMVEEADGASTATIMISAE
jgi:hypothetical protein